MCFDKDNCLTLPYGDEIEPSLKTAFEECKVEFGQSRMAVLSNSAGSSDDIPVFTAASKLEAALGIPVIRHGGKVKMNRTSYLAHPFGRNQIVVMPF